jgi:hypothetical protein
LVEFEKKNNILWRFANMTRKYPILVLTLALLFIASLSIAVGCSKAATTTPTASPALTATPTTVPPTTTTLPVGGGGGAVINSDSIVTAQLQAINKQSTGYPWQLDVLIQSSVDVGNLPNPTKDSVGKVISLKTDQDMTSFKVNDVVTAKVKYVGDVPRPGITLYMYNIALQTKP